MRSVAKKQLDPQKANAPAKPVANEVGRGLGGATDQQGWLHLPSPN